MTASTSPQRAMIARVAAHESWARTPDRAARTAPARRAALARFDKLADPEGVLPTAERARRAEHLAKAHYQRMALRSAQARSRAGFTVGAK